MILSDVKCILGAEVLTKSFDPDRKIGTICGSDMMSDVLAFMKKDALLLTGLCNPQVIRTAEMLDVVCIAYVRGKRPSQEVIDMAEENGIYILHCTYPMFEACGLLYTASKKEDSLSE